MESIMPLRPPDENTNITVRVLVGLVIWLTISNTLFQWFGKPYADPWWIITLATGALSAIVYTSYENRRIDAEREQKKLSLARRQRILLIEDSPITAEFLRRLLLQQDVYFDLAVAGTAETALKMLRRQGDYRTYQLPDQIWLDLDLGAGMSGAEFMTVVKADPYLSWIPINVFTASPPDRGDMMLADAGWINAWVQKGQGPEAIIDAMNSASELSLESRPKELPYYDVDLADPEEEDEN
jgi:CheY-like chemotaxis protein